MKNVTYITIILSLLIITINSLNTTQSKCKIAFRKYLSATLNNFSPNYNLPKINISILNSGTNFLNLGNQKACLQLSPSSSIKQYRYLILHGIITYTNVLYHSKNKYELNTNNENKLSKLDNDYYSTNYQQLHTYSIESAIGWCFRKECLDEPGYIKDELQKTKELIAYYFNRNSTEETYIRLNFTDPTEILLNIQEAQSTSYIIIIIILSFFGVLGILSMILNFYFDTNKNQEKESIIFEINRNIFNETNDNNNNNIYNNLPYKSNYISYTSTNNKYTTNLLFNNNNYNNNNNYHDIPHNESLIKSILDESTTNHNINYTQTNNIDNNHNIHYINIDKKKNSKIKIMTQITIFDPLESLTDITMIHNKEKTEILNGLKTISLFHITIGVSFMLMIQYPLKNKEELYIDILEKRVFYFLMSEFAFEMLFAISGFLLVVNLHKIKNRSAFIYLVKRFFRLFPILVIGCFLPGLLVNIITYKPLVVYLNEFLINQPNTIWRNLLFINNFYGNEFLVSNNDTQRYEYLYNNSVDSINDINGTDTTFSNHADLPCKSNINFYLLWFITSDYLIHILMSILYSTLNLKYRVELKFIIYFGITLFTVGFSFFIIYSNNLTPWDILTIYKANKYNTENINTNYGIPQYWTYNEYFNHYYCHFFNHLPSTIIGMIFGEQYLKFILKELKSKNCVTKLIKKMILNKSFSFYFILASMSSIIASLLSYYFLLNYVTKDSAILIFIIVNIRFVFVFSVFSFVFVYLTTNHFSFFYEVINNICFSIIAKVSLSISVLIPFFTHFFIINKGDAIYYSKNEVYRLGTRVFFFSLIIGICLACFIELPLRRIFNKKKEDN